MRSFLALEIWGSTHASNKDLTVASPSNFEGQKRPPLDQIGRLVMVYWVLCGMLASCFGVDDNPFVDLINHREVQSEDRGVIHEL